LKAADVFIFPDTSGEVSFDIHGEGDSHSRVKKKKGQAKEKKKSDEMLHKLRDVKSRCLFTLYL